MIALKKPEIIEQHPFGNSVWIENLENGPGTEEQSFINSVSSVFVPGKPFFEISENSGKIISKIKSFRKLSPNWDSYGAVQPEDEVINKAISFVLKAEVIDELIPSFAAAGPNGEILIEYKNKDVEAEVYIESNGDEVLVYRGEECVLEGNIDENYQELVKLISENG